MSGNTGTIWGTLEAHCWAGGFEYKEYVEMHTTQLHSNRPLCEEAYNTAVKMFNAQFEHDENLAAQKREEQDNLEGL